MVALHVLDNEDIVIVVEIRGGSGCILADTRMDGDELVELGLRREFTLGFTGELGLFGEDVNVFPYCVFLQRERTVVDSGGDTALVVVREFGPTEDVILGCIVDAAVHTRKFGCTHSPCEGLLNVSAIVCHNRLEF